MRKCLVILALALSVNVMAAANAYAADFNNVYSEAEFGDTHRDSQLSVSNTANETVAETPAVSPAAAPQLSGVPAKRGTDAGRATWQKLLKESTINIGPNGPE